MSIVGQLLRLGLALRALASSAGGGGAADAALHGIEEDAADEFGEDDWPDDAAWLETVPVVEGDPEREAERRRCGWRSSARSLSENCLGVAALVLIQWRA